MRIELVGLGKRFNEHWVLRYLSYSFESGNSYAILGPNGSGKSTLLQIIGGMLSPSEGSSLVFAGAEAVDPEQVHRYASFCAPAMELVEEFTLLEFFGFQHHFRPLLSGFDPQAVIREIGLTHAGDLQIRHFSSGMRQRVKLAQAIFCDCPVVLLDEPCTNLDQEGISLYQRLMDRWMTGRMLIVGSNSRPEYTMCKNRLELTIPTRKPILSKLP
ncbi:MAG TPA: ATP-binding cassette domain-containing protein [Chitinophagaceae bacterium]|nr:ATP-binding cassette domain-containing protein [Chitinophagaceae bacterium]